jgi:geranylgeranyl reductase family protein
MSSLYDILIVGAGPAGCAAAYDLARAGKHVLLLDKRSFPRHKACACGLTRKTLAALRYSVDPVIERVCNEIVLQQAAPDPKHRELRIRARQPICAMAVRERFDDFCLQQTLAAAANGGSVTLRKIETILALRELPTRVELDIATSEGTETLTAPILLGADGSNGQTRRLYQTLHDKPSPSAQDPAQDGFALEAMIPYNALPAHTYSGLKRSQLQALSNPHDLVFDFAPIPGGYGWLFPKGDHINIGIGAFAPGGDPSRLKQVTRNLLADYTRNKLGIELSSIAAHITGQHLGMGGHAYIPQGRILLAGDAAGLVDPLTGEGIHSALVSGQAAATAVLETAADGKDVAVAYARHLAPLLQTLQFSHRAARAFYAEPERGFRVMRVPGLRSLVLKTYTDGLPPTGLLTRLARAVA